MNGGIGRPSATGAATRRQLKFTLPGPLTIVDTVAVVVDEHLESGHGNPTSVDDVLSCERWARSRAHDLTGGSV